MRHWLLYTVLLVATLAAPHAVFAAPATIDTSSSAQATANSAQRKTFFDSTNSRHWAFYYNGTAIEYSYSPDGTTWTSAGTLAYNTPSFSAVYKNIGGTSYVFVVAEGNSYDVVLRRGTLGVSAVTFDAEITAFDGSGVNDLYTKPTVALSENNHLWLSTIKDNGPFVERFEARVRRSTNTADGNLSALNAATSVDQKVPKLSDAVILPQNGDGMYLITSTEGTSIVGYTFDGAQWSSANTGGDYSWFGFKSADLITNAVRVITISGTDVYFGGSFTDAANIPEADFLVKWDGDNWSALGSNGAGDGAIGNIFIGVREIVVSGNDVYVGGDFLDAGGVAEADNIAKWDGNSWSALGNNGAGDGALNWSVNTIALSGGNLYAGGSFENAAGIAEADKIAVWDGNSWSAIGSNGAGNGALNDFVENIIVSGSDLYVAGGFTDAAGVAEADYIARWDGSAWSALGSNGAGNGALDFYAYELQISGSDLYVGGEFQNAATIPEADYIARWNGTTWSALGSNGAGNGALNEAVVEMLISGSDLYIGGYHFDNVAGIPEADNIARWNGTSWSALGSNGAGDGALNGSVAEAIAISGTTLYVGGQFQDASGIAEADYIATWDGTNWHSFIQGGLDGAVSALLVSGTDLYVGGSFEDAGGINEADFIAKWDGTAWSALGSNGAGNGAIPSGFNVGVNALALSGSDLYVGGSFQNVAGIAEADKLARWNGSAWSALGSNGAGNGALITGFGGVNALVVSGGNLYVGGGFSNAGAVATADYVAMWNGAAWSSLGNNGAGNGALGSTVNAIAVSGTDVYVGGNFTNARAVATADYIARWNGAAWSALGSNGAGNGAMNSAVYALTISGTDLYAGGAFTNAAAIATADYIAKWNGAAWSALGDNGAGNGAINGDVRAIKVSGSDFYVGGSFQDAGNIAQADSIAIWDGSAWSAIGSNRIGDDGALLYGSIYAVAILGDDLFLGGSATLSATNIPTTLAYYSPVIAKDADESTELSATSDANADIYLTYTNSDDEVKFRRYDESDAQWEAAVTLNATASSSPSITYKNSDGRVTASWIESNSLNYRHALTPYQAADWKTEATIYNTGTNSSATTVANQETGILQVAWTNGAANPYNVYADLLAMDSAPTVTISSTAGSATNSSPIPVTFQFNKTVTGFAVGDITVGNGSAGNFATVDGDTYTADITPTAEGNVTVNVAGAVAKDLFDNDNSIATQLSISYDTTAPTVVISSTATSPTNTSPIPVTFQFSQTVTGFVVGDITVGNGTAGNFVAVDGDTYTADITPTAQGAVTVDVAASRCDDAAGNDNTAATQFAITYDSVAPTVVISSTATSPTNTSPIPVTFQFSQTVTGFVVGDITVGNGTAGNFVAVDGDTYTADITPTAQGAVTVDVAASKCDDAAGNDNTAATQFPITYDSVAPSVVISSTATSPTSTSPISLTFEFSEAVSGFTIGDLSVDNASKSNFIAVDGNTYTASITPTNSGEITVNITAAAAIDASGNSSTAATQFSILYEANDTDTDGDEVIDTQEAIDETNPLDPGSFVSVLPTSWCSDWNGYFSMYNVNEYTNLSGASRHLVATLVDNNGEAQSATGFSIGEDQQTDLLVHALEGWQEESYGEVCTEVTNGQKGDVNGRMVYYKPNASGFDFAFALPYQAGLHGSQFVTFNTMQPSLDPDDSENTIANWIQLTNLEEMTQQGSLIFYGFDGTVLASEAVTLTSRARRDFSTHQLGSGIVGTVEWRPQSSTAKFVLINTRYFYDNSEMLESFDGAVQLEGTKGNGEKLSTLLDTRNQTAVLEVANTTASTVATTIKIYDASGTLRNEQLLTLAPHVSLHIVANQYLSEELGSATIDGSAIGSILAVGMHYGKTETGSISHSYGLIAKQALGTTVHGSYNTYLGQSCELLLLNTTASAVNSTVSMKRLDATPVLTDETIATPAFGSASFDVCAEDEVNQYGVVTVVAGTKNAITPVIIRSGANGDYRFVTPLR